MCAFEIGGSERNPFSNGISFGSVQAMQKKQEDADAKKAEEKNSLSLRDTVSISDEAKAAINNKLGRVEDNSGENSTGTTSLDSLKLQVSKAAEAINKINGPRENEDEKNAIEEGSEGFKMEFKSMDGGSVSRKPSGKTSTDEKAEDEKAEDEKVADEEASSLEKIKQEIEGQIKGKQADIRAASSDLSEDGQVKKRMLEGQLMGLESTLTELEAKGDD